MNISLIPLLSFVLVSTFTPGPSNISTASLAVLHGYRNTLRFQSGLALGVFLLMFLSGWFSSALLDRFPAIEPVMRYAGAAYILYLAFGLLRATYGFAEEEAKPLQFLQGLMLNVLNPKLVVYALTLFSAFLAPITGNILVLTVVCLLLAAVSFAATSTWAVLGTSIKTYLGNPRLTLVINVLLSLTLVYTAAALIGLL